jgi:hypothetical protein
METEAVKENYWSFYDCILILYATKILCLLLFVSDIYKERKLRNYRYEAS